MSTERSVRPPGGSPPPSTAHCGDAIVDLRPLAEEIADRYLARYPDHPGIARDVVRQWEVHDTCHLLRWAFDDAAGLADLGREAAWLAAVLASRGFPIERLGVNMQLCADVVSELSLDGDDAASATVADRVREVAGAILDGVGSEP